MSTDPKPADNEVVLPTIRRLEEAVVNRIAAGEVPQPDLLHVANCLHHLHFVQHVLWYD